MFILVILLLFSGLLVSICLTSSVIIIAGILDRGIYDSLRFYPMISTYPTLATTDMSLCPLLALSSPLPNEGCSPAKSIASYLLSSGCSCSKSFLGYYLELFEILSTYLLGFAEEGRYIERSSFLLALSAPFVKNLDLELLFLFNIGLLISLLTAIILGLFYATLGAFPAPVTYLSSMPPNYCIVYGVPLFNDLEHRESWRASK